MQTFRRTFLLFISVIFTAGLYSQGTVTDTEGNEYSTIMLYGREWMVENLRVTTYNNGDSLVAYSDESSWRNLSEGGYGVYPHADIEGINTEEEMTEAYGKLYNWYAVNDPRGICPVGWEVPSEELWLEVRDEADPQAMRNRNVLGLKLKSQRQENSPFDGYDTSEHPRWDEHDKNHGTDEYGFEALPAGSINNEGRFVNIGEYAYFWTATQNTEYDTQAFAMVMLSIHAGTSAASYYKTSGFSVRCVRSENGPEPQTYDLTISLEGEGTTDPVAGTHTYNEGTEVDLTATPGDGWEFERWVIEGDDVMESSTQVTMDGDISAVAHFAEEEENGNGLPSVEVNGTTVYVHPEDHDQALEWGGDGTTTNAGSDIDGFSNTQTIIDVLEDNEGVPYAAQYCDNLVSEGFDDWYLPAKDELNAVYENKDEIGGFTYNFYWSSTEYDHRYAWYQSFDAGFQDWEERKFSNHGVRCVRKDND